MRDWIIQVHLEHQVTLVVLESDIKPRFEVLDEFALQQERLRFAFHDMHVEIKDGLDEGIEFHVPTQSPRGMKILTDAFAQIPGLAHINDGAEAVLMQIDTGLVRHGGQLFTDGFGNRHARISTQRRKDAKEIIDLQMAQMNYRFEFQQVIRLSLRESFLICGSFSICFKVSERIF